MSARLLFALVTLAAAATPADARSSTRSGRGREGEDGPTKLKRHADRCRRGGVIGRGVASTLAGYYTLDRNEKLTEYVNLVGLTVASSQPRSDIYYRFGVLDTDQVNAFATPGGYIFVTRGALALMQDEAELAGVLAHEVGHVNEKHVVKEIQKRARTSLGAEVAQEALDADSEVFDKVVGLGTSVLFWASRARTSSRPTAWRDVRARAGYDPGACCAS